MNNIPIVGLLYHVLNLCRMKSDDYQGVTGRNILTIFKRTQSQLMAPALGKNTSKMV